MTVVICLIFILSCLLSAMLGGLHVGRWWAGHADGRYPFPLIWRGRTYYVLDVQQMHAFRAFGFGSRRNLAPQHNHYDSDGDAA